MSEPVSPLPPEATTETESPPVTTATAVSFRHTFRALRHRNFRLFTIGQIISLVGTWMEQTAMGWLVYQLTHSTVLLGTVMAAGTAPMVLFSVWGGSLADRYAKRTILMITQTVAMVLAFLLAGLVYFGHITPWQIIGLSLLNGIAAGFDMPARQSFVVEMTSREDLMNAITLGSSVFNSARLIGPAMAGLVLAHGTAAGCFFINGVSFIAAIIALAAMRFPARVAVARPAQGRAHALEGFRYVWNHARIRTTMVLFAVVAIFGWSYAVLLPAYAHDVLRLGADGYGLLVSTAGVGALTGALSLAALGHKVRSRVVALGGVWFSSVMLIGFAFAPNLAVAVVAQGLISLGFMLFFSTANTTMQQLVSDEMRGRVMGVWSVVFGCVIPIGGLQAGWMARVIGIRWTMVGGAVVCALAALVTFVVVRRREAGLERGAENGRLTTEPVASK